MSDRFYWDADIKTWRPTECIRVKNGEEEHFDEYDDHLLLDETARVAYETARILTANLLSYLTLIQICLDQELRDDWIEKAKNLLLQIKNAINVDENADLRSRIAENLDNIYDDAMIAVFEEVGNSIENEELKILFRDEISKEIRSEILKALRIIRANRKISKELIDKLKDRLEIPEKSPWTVEDFLTVEFHEDQLEMIRNDFWKYLRTKHNEKFKFLNL